MKPIVTSFWHFNFGHLLTLVVITTGGIGFYVQKEKETVILRGNMDSIAAIVHDHVANKSEHMPFDVKMATFVTRTEFNSQIERRESVFADIRATLREISNKIDDIRKDALVEARERAKK